MEVRVPLVQRLLVSRCILLGSAQAPRAGLPTPPGGQLDLKGAAICWDCRNCEHRRAVRNAPLRQAPGTAVCSLTHGDHREHWEAPLKCTGFQISPTSFQTCVCSQPDSALRQTLPSDRQHRLNQHLQHELLPQSTPCRELRRTQLCPGTASKSRGTHLLHQLADQGVPHLHRIRLLQPPPGHPLQRSFLVTHHQVDEGTAVHNALCEDAAAQRADGGVPGAAGRAPWLCQIVLVAVQQHLKRCIYTAPAGVSGSVSSSRFQGASAAN